jgi:hypothetical protein
MRLRPPHTTTAHPACNAQHVAGVQAHCTTNPHALHAQLHSAGRAAEPHIQGQVGSGAVLCSSSGSGSGSARCLQPPSHHRFSEALAACFQSLLRPAAARGRRDGARRPSPRATAAPSSAVREQMGKSSTAKAPLRVRYRQLCAASPRGGLMGVLLPGNGCSALVGGPQQARLVPMVPPAGKERRDRV